MKDGLIFNDKADSQWESALSLMVCLTYSENRQNFYCKSVYLHFTLSAYLMQAANINRVEFGKYFGNQPVGYLIQQARQGVVRCRVDEIARLVGLTDIEMARILNMSVRSLHGKGANEQLNLAASERLLLLERLVQHGLHVFDGRVELLGRWLRSPLPELAYREVGNYVKPTEPLSLMSMGSFSEPVTQASESTILPDKNSIKSAVSQSPLAVLDTVSGFSLAEDVLARIEWGIVG